MSRLRSSRPLRCRLAIDLLAGVGIGLGLLCLNLVAATDALAQAPGKSDTVEDQAAVAEPPTAIAIPDIPTRTDDLQKLLRRIETVLDVDPRVKEIESGISELASKDRERVEEARAILSRPPTLDQLNDLDREWGGRQRQLRDWRKTLSGRAASLEGYFEELAGLRTIWQVTFENAKPSEAPVEVVAIVKANLTNIDTVRGHVGDRRSAVLSLLSRVSVEETTGSEIVEQIALARSEFRARLLEPDAAPFWAIERLADSEIDSVSLIEATRSDWRKLVEFTSLQASSLWPVGVAFAATLLMTLSLRRRMLRTANQDHLEGSASVVERPISAAILVTTLLSLSTFSFAPQLMRNMISLSLLVPLYRILSPLVPDTIRSVLWTLGSFYLIDRTRDFLSVFVLLERSMLLAETIGASAILFFYLRRRAAAVSVESVPETNFMAIVNGGFWIACGLLALSSFGNLVGYADFARIVGEGTLRGLYLALVAYAGFRIGTTFLLLALSSERLTSIAIIRRNASVLLIWGKGFQILVLGGSWLFMTLEGFALGEQVVSWVMDRLMSSHELGSISISIMDLILFPLVLFLAYTLSRVIRAVLEDEVYPRVRLERGIPNAISTAAHYLVLFLGFLIALGAAGIDLGRFSLLAGALGVGIGFGLQNVVNNFVSGLILLVERPIQVGDVIEVGDLLGRVTRIGIRACTVVTYQGAEVIVPNGNLLSDQLVNWTLSSQSRRVELPVGVAYGNRPERILEVLKRVIGDAENVLRHPAPTVLFRGFGDSSLDFEIRFWASEDRFMQASSDVASDVYDALAEEGIEIPFPQRDLHLRSVEPGVIERFRGGRGEAGRD